MSRHGLETAPPPEMCAVILFFHEMENSKGYERQMYLDGNHIAEIPLLSAIYWVMSTNDDWAPYYQRIFTRLLVTEGEHELKITTRHRPHEYNRKLKCKGGEVFYVYPRHKLAGSEPYGIWRARIQVEGDVEIYDQPMEAYDDWKRLLFYSGKWYGSD